MQCLQWFLTVLGCTLIITQSSLFRPFREFFEKHIPYAGERLSTLFSCPMCTGFWVGFIACAGFGFKLSGATEELHPFFRCMAHGCMASFACWTMHVILVKLGQTRMLRPETVEPEKKGELTVSAEKYAHNKEPQRKNAA